MVSIMDIPLYIQMAIQVGVPAMVLTTLFSRWKQHVIKAFLFVIAINIFVDGAHLINKDLTHNIFVLVEAPIAMYLVGYVIDSERVKILSASILVVSSFLFIMDSVLEGDGLAVYYPVSTVRYTFFSTSPRAEAGMLFLWLITSISFSDFRTIRKPHIKHSPAVAAAVTLLL